MVHERIDQAGLFCWDRVAFYFSGLCSHCSWEFTHLFSTHVLLNPYMLRLPSPLGVCVCVCVKPCIISYIQTRYTSANQQAIEVNGHHDFAANRHVVGYRFRWGWGTSMPSKNARKWVWKGFNFKCDYRHHIVITNDSDFNWPHLQMCGVFVFGKSWPKRSLT